MKTHLSGQVVARLGHIRQKRVCVDVRLVIQAKRLLLRGQHTQPLRRSPLVAGRMRQLVQTQEQRTASEDPAQHRGTADKLEQVGGGRRHFLGDLFGCVPNFHLLARALLLLIEKLLLLLDLLFEGVLLLLKQLALREERRRHTGEPGAYAFDRFADLAPGVRLLAKLLLILLEQLVKPLKRLVVNLNVDDGMRHGRLPKGSLGELAQQPNLMPLTVSAGVRKIQLEVLIAPRGAKLAEAA